MLHAFDTSSMQRPQWMALLARAPLSTLEDGLRPFGDLPRTWLRPPETGLMMVEARAGGSGQRFNLGEATVTRCTLRLDNTSGHATAGVAYVMGRDTRHAELAALADALLQTDTHGKAVREQVLNPALAALSERRATAEQATRTTKVEFFTVAREAGADTDTDEGADE